MLHDPEPAGVRKSKVEAIDVLRTLRLYLLAESFEPIHPDFQLPIRKA
jgi:hypothetical protein